MAAARYDGATFITLGNIIYTGRIKIGEEIFPGEDDEIIDVATFD